MPAGERCGAGGLGIEHRARPQQQLAAQPLGHLLDDPLRARHGESDFDGLDAAGQQGLGHVEEHFAAGRAEHGHHARADDSRQGCVFGHGRSALEVWLSTDIRETADVIPPSGSVSQGFAV